MPKISTLKDAARLFTLLLLVAMAATYVSNLANEEIAGRVIVLDGDSLRVEGREVRLAGIDAPEHGQMCQNAADNVYDCGARAKRELQRLAMAGYVRCESSAEDQYGRALAECLVDGSQISLNETMVRLGWAVDYGGYSGAEFMARRKGIGLWAGSFDRPHDYRAGKSGQTGSPWLLRLLGRGSVDD
ncbi:MAG: thermonuclease family protein [Pseudomonadota bacterium]